MPPSSRGRSTFRGSGRGRGGRGGRGVLQRGRNRFHSSRVDSREKQEDLDSDQSNDPHIEDEEQSSSEESESEPEAPVVRPYQALVQSLQVLPDAVLEEPARKKRRADLSDDTNGRKDGYNGLALEDPVLLEAEPDVDEDAASQSDDDFQSNFDPFRTHFGEPADPNLKAFIADVNKNIYTVIPLQLNKNINREFRKPSSFKQSLHYSVLPESIKELKLKGKLGTQALGKTRRFTTFEKHLAYDMFGYTDLFMTFDPHKQTAQYEQLLALHITNHIFKTRDQVMKNNLKINKNDEGEDLDLRDQGYTRPKALIILPTRQACARMVDLITDLTQPEQQENKKRFQEAFTGPDADYIEGKPDDFKRLFGGNDDDMFRVGLKITRKTIKFFSPFYSSDIILASPLGLRMALGDLENKKPDYDFLSSIEIAAVLNTEALLMQNWDHMEYIFAHLNLEPKEAHGCDFSRVRNWCLEGYSKHMRQTIISTAFDTPEIQHFANLYLRNFAGRSVYRDEPEGAMLDINFRVKQSFILLKPKVAIDDSEERFEYFKSNIIAEINKAYKSSPELGLLIYIPSYLDFVPIRNHFSTHIDAMHISFGAISEYSSVPEVARARSHFLNGKHGVLLYSERAHHFRRYALRGVKKVFFFGLPENPIFYSEVVGFMNRTVAEGKVDAGKIEAKALYSAFDRMKLDRLVGAERAGSMIRRKAGTVVDFVTD